MSRPPRALGIVIGVTAIVILAAADVLFFVILQRTPVNLFTPLWVALILFSLPVLVFVAYRTFSLINARYRFTQNALVIAWGPAREIIPMREITGLLIGKELPGDLAPRGLWWPGCLVGRGHTKTVGDLTYYATTPQSGQLIVVTTFGGYVISPENADAFIDAFESEGRKGILEPVEHTYNRPAFYEWELWRDRWAQALVGISFILPFLLMAAIAFRIPSLPPSIPLHFNINGLPDRTGPPTGLFILPVIGGLVWLVNSLVGGILHVRRIERPAAYLLWLGSGLVQAFLWAAAIGLL